MENTTKSIIFDLVETAPEVGHVGASLKENIYHYRYGIVASIIVFELLFIAVI